MLQASEKLISMYYRVYLHPPNRKYVISNVNINAVGNVSIKLNFRHL